MDVSAHGISLSVIENRLAPILKFEGMTPTYDWWLAKTPIVSTYSPKLYFIFC